MDTFDDTPSRQHQIVVLSSVMLGVATLALILRFWSNYISPTHKFGWDDFFAYITLPCIVIETALIFWWVTLGLGRRAATLPPENVAKAPLIIYIATFFFKAEITFPKLSALFFYNRVFERTNMVFTYCLRGIAGASGAWLIAALVSNALMCNPPNAIWDPEVAAKGAHCFSQYYWFLGTALTSTLLDLAILILPMPRLWKLQLSPSRKVLLTAVFFCGYGVVAVSIGRLVAILSPGSALLADITWTPVDYIMWVQCEGSLSVTLVCLPSCFYLVRRLWEINGPEIRKTFSGNSSSSSSSRKQEKYSQITVSHEILVARTPMNVEMGDVPSKSSREQREDWEDYSP